MSLENVQIAELSSAELDSLFNETPGADTLAVGAEIEKNEPVEVSTLESKQGLGSIPIIDEKDLENLELTTEEEGKETETIEKGEDKTTVTNDNNALLQSTTEYLINSGIWSDFEGRKELELTPELYGKLASKQAEEAAYELFNEMVDQTGSYGKAIMGHIRSGGNPDEIIDLFKEQKEIQKIDTSSEDGKQQKIEQYYKDVVGWKPERIQKYINRLVTDDAINDEFDEIEPLYNNYFDSKLQKIQYEAQEENRKKVEKQTKFANSIKDAINDNTELTDREKRIIASSILDFKHKLPNGQKVNDFYLKFAEIQEDPKKYVELVQFCMDNEKFLKKVQQKENTKASKEIFTFIKGNAAVNKNSGAEDVSVKEGKTTKKQGTDFSFILKK